MAEAAGKTAKGEQTRTLILETAMLLFLAIPAAVVEDPDDDPILQTAVSGRADVLCTRDLAFLPGRRVDVDQFAREPELRYRIHVSSSVLVSVRSSRYFTMTGVASTSISGKLISTFANPAC